MKYHIYPIRMFWHTPRQALAWLAVVLAAMLLFGVYLQYGVGLSPCPMCIVQRYLYIAMLIWAVAGALGGRNRTVAVGAWILVLITALLGAYVAAHQSWLQWYPPAFYSCGRSVYGMIEQMPLSQALPRIFAGGGDCTQTEWTLLGLSLANWSFLAFGAGAVLAVAWIWRLLRR